MSRSLLPWALLLDSTSHGVSVLGAAFLGFTVLASVSRPAAAELRFHDVAEEMGIHFLGTAGAPPREDLSEVNGSGIAAGDIDGDGRIDLYVVQGVDRSLDPVPRNRLYLNRGDHFEEEAARFGVDDPGRGAGAVLCDLDGDGRCELLLSNFGPDRAFTNDEGHRFVPRQGFSDPGMGMGIAVADFDQDGWGDAYVARYVRWPRVVPRRGGPCQWKGVPVICGPEAYRPQPDVYFHGGPGGTLTLAPRMRPRPLRPGRGMGTLVVDADHDGRPDLYVANDASDNFLFLHREGNWREEALAMGCALSAAGKPEAGMGVAIGDVDGDGLEDLLVTNFDGQTHSYYRAVHAAEGGGDWFEESAAAARLAATSLRRLSWGVQLADLDNDGDLDLHVTNGHLYDNADEIGDGTHWRQPDDLFVNDGNGRFTAQEEGWDGVDAESGRGSAVIDFDDDGRLDLVIWNLGAPLRLLHNESSETGRWLKLWLHAPQGVPEATLVGAEVELYHAGRRQVRSFRRGSGYLGCNDPRMHFGLGGSSQADSVRVRWPWGAETVLRGLKSGQTHEITAPPRK